ncbi:MAG: glutamate synthase-related protein [Actinomycetota bacterium]
MSWWQWLLVALVGFLLIVTVYDLVQRRHAILRNFPVIGHLRFLLEAVGPELRQYIVTDNDADKPFSRDQRRWVYTSAKQVNTYYGFGTDNDLEGSNHYLIVKQAPFPLDEPHPVDPAASMPMAKVLGGPMGRRSAFRAPSAVNISSMSFGSLSARAVESLNRGAARAGCWQGTGEGGITDHHRHGGDLVWQIGTGYFGCRDERGRFDLGRFRAVVEAEPTIRAIEIKLSQGAKPGIGGLLPGAKVTREIASIRGVDAGVDCVSPAAHSAFSDADSLLDFVELLAETSGKPVGIKSAVGDDTVFRNLARLMERGERGVDFVTVDGGEGGTGAGPLVFTDHVALPFKVGFSRVYRAFAEAGLTDRIVFIGAGKLGLPAEALLAFALGCDGVNVGREALLAIGCIQAQRCHTDRCPTGVTTQSKWRQRGIDPADKSVRCAGYVTQLRREVLRLSRACGVIHPALVTTDQIEILDDHYGSRVAREVFGYAPGWGRPSAADQAALRAAMATPRTGAWPTPGRSGRAGVAPSTQPLPPRSGSSRDAP